jgi:hypothetical protein
MGVDSSAWRFTSDPYAFSRSKGRNEDQEAARARRVSPEVREERERREREEEGGSEEDPGGGVQEARGGEEANGGEEGGGVEEGTREGSRRLTGGVRRRYRENTSRRWRAEGGRRERRSWN